MSAVPILAFRQIEKSFGAIRALRGVNFELQAGEVHALLGENGAGKSTLIKVATGAHAPDAGTIEVAGEVVRRIDPLSARKHGIACIYQQPALFPDLTVEENLALRLEPSSSWRRVDWSTRRQRAEMLLSRIGAHFGPDREVRTLSMPEQQLVEIACALGAGARIVIMDEPTASLTRQEQERLFSLVRALRAQSVGVIYISHRLEEIFALADRVTVLRDGASIGTHVVTSMSESRLIELMVGREVAHLYPPTEFSGGAIRLDVRELVCKAGGLKKVSFTVKAGEILGLSGLVGAGRTELARTLFGITPADAGEIRVDGQLLSVSNPRVAVAAGIAYVPEDRRRHGVVLEMPVSHNLTLAARRRYFPWGILRPRVEREAAGHFVESLGIKTAGIGAPAGSLSGGNQQKVSLGRWLATEPKILILDEPTQGVDVGAKGELHRIIRRLAAKGLAVILISSDLPEILGMSDRIGVMREGRLVTVLPGGSSAAAVMAAALGKTEEEKSA